MVFIAFHFLTMLIMCLSDLPKIGNFFMKHANCARDLIIFAIYDCVSFIHSYYNKELQKYEFDLNKIKYLLN